MTDLNEAGIEKAAEAFEEAWDGGIESGAVDDMTPTEFIHNAMSAAVTAYLEATGGDRK